MKRKLNNPRLREVSKKTQFKPGVSGNPAGKPKGTRSMGTILREMMSEEVSVLENGQQVRKPFADIIIRKLIKKANEGNIQAIREIFDRVDGKVGQEIELSSPDNSPRFVVIVKNKQTAKEVEKLK